jgi:pentatricopeptide repeat protein
MLQLMNRWIDERGEASSYEPWRGLPNRLLNAIKETSPVNVEDGVQLLNKLDSMPDDAHRPDPKAFTMVLAMLHMSTGDRKRTVQVAEDLFRRALDRGGRNDVRVWSAYLNVLAHCSIGNVEVSDEAEEILKEMIQLKLMCSHCVSSVLHSLANSGRPERAHALLERLRNTDGVEVTDIMFNTCIDAYAKQGNGEQAEALLRTMLENSDITPDTFSFSSAINAWTRSGHPEAAERAEQLLTLMEKTGCALNAMSYTPVIVAWTQSRKPFATERALELLHTMESRCLRGDEGACPTHVTYTAAIHALAKSQDPNAVEKAENLLQRMKDVARSGRKDFVVNKIAYSAVIDVIAKSRAPGAGMKAVALLREMQDLAGAGDPHVIAPNVFTYNSVIAAFAYLGEASHARSLLEEMIEEAARGNHDVSPNSSTYGTVMNSYANWRSPESAQQALALLAIMETNYKNDKSKPRPNVYVYTGAIEALTHGEKRTAPDLAQALLERMQAEFKAGNADAKPNAKSLGTVLEVFAVHLAKFKLPERITSLLEWALAESMNGNVAIKPDRYCYNLLLMAWAQSRRNDALLKMYEILRIMSTSKDEHSKPDTHSYVQLMTVIHRSKTYDAPIENLRILHFLLEEYAKGKRRLQPSSRALHLALASCDCCQILDEIGRIMLDAEEWLLTPFSFQLFFEASRRLAFGNASLLEELYNLSKKTTKWDSGVEEAYTGVYT